MPGRMSRVRVCFAYGCRGLLAGSECALLMGARAYEQGEGVLCLWISWPVSRVRVCSVYGCRGL